MTYSALVTRIHHTPVPGLDNLVAGNVSGYQVLVGKDTPQGALGLFFEMGGQLSEEFAKANDLVRRKNEDGTPAGGMFEENRRVRGIKLRGQRSDGFWIPLSSLFFTKLDPTDAENLVEGDQISEWNGIPICNKYFTQATRERGQGNRQGRARRECPMFREHVETEAFLKNLHMIPDGSTVTITEKLHGTSLRYGHVLDEVPIKRNWFMTLLAKYLKWPTTDSKWVYLNGTRRTILEKYEGQDYYGNEQFRANATKPLEGKLFQGEVIYGELVGYTESGKTIMDTHDTTSLKDKAITKRYGDKITYSYGTEPGECKLFVYRITRHSEELGRSYEYSDDYMRQRCKELGLDAVPKLELPLYENNDEYLIRFEDDVPDLVKYVDSIVNGTGSEALPSTLDTRHIREGVVVRVDHPTLPTVFLKHKSYVFGVLEGYLKDKEEYVDLEEAA